mmetsp:Transcript_8581/g.23887  ORF Transcript_8581/g.23887 Transcript_8581/m.23887 type:complete len:138 (-) Transcript_8581:240-653(-)
MQPECTGHVRVLLEKSRHRLGFVASLPFLQNEATSPLRSLRCVFFSCVWLVETAARRARRSLDDAVAPLHVFNGGREGGRVVKRKAKKWSPTRLSGTQVLVRWLPFCVCTPHEGDHQCLDTFGSRVGSGRIGSARIV